MTIASQIKAVQEERRLQVLLSGFEIREKFLTRHKFTNLLKSVW